MARRNTILDIISEDVARAPNNPVDEVISNSVSAVAYRLNASVEGEVYGALDDITSVSILEAVQ